MKTYTEKTKKIINHIIENVHRNHMNKRNNIIKEHLSLILNETYWMPENIRLAERFYCILNDIFERPICLNCKKKNPRFENLDIGYRIYCSNKCSTTSFITREKTKITFQENYGGHPFQNPEIQEKIKATNQKKYGCEYPTQTQEVKDKIKVTNQKKYGCEYPAQNKEIQEKTKKFFQEKYGCDNPTQTQEVKDKIKATNKKKYGCDCSLQNPEIQEKRKATWEEKYGGHPMKTQKVKDKTNATWEEKYGGHPSQSQKVKDKVKATFQEKYGCDCSLQNPEIQEKRKVTWEEKYGCRNPFMSPEIKKKIKATNQEKYGGHPSQNPEIREKWKKTMIKNGSFFGNYSKISQEVFWKIYNQLSKKLQGKTYFAELNHEFGKANKPKSYMYDFVISSLKLCIEYNGDMWHANPNIYKEDDCPNPFRKDLTSKEIWNYDKKKFDVLENIGFKMLIVWESEYKENPDKIIKNCLHFINNT